MSLHPHLLPCPFCGEDIEKTNKDDDTTWMWIHSDNGCVMAMHCIDKDEVKPWNRRGYDSERGER